MIQSSNSRLNESLLHALNVNQQVIANNIANVDTPHYKTKSVVFQEELKRKLAQDSRRDLDMKRTHPSICLTELRMNPRFHSELSNRRTPS